MDSVVQGAPTATTAASLNFTPIILGIVAILGIIGALKGLRRGASRQLIRSLTIVASVIISYLIATSLYTSFSSFLEGKTMADIEALLVQNGILSPDTDTSWIQNLDIETVELVAAMPLALIAMPVLFVICFIIISALMLIVHFILSTIFGFSKRRNNFATRLTGMALGLIQGIVVAGLVLMPVIGISNTVAESVNVMKEKAPENSTTVTLSDTYDSYIKSVAENPASKVLGTLGINSLYKSIATVEIDGKKSDTTTLLPDVALIFGETQELKGADFKNLTPENEATITRIFDIAESNDYLTRILAGVIKSVSYAYTNDAIDLPLDEPFDSIMDSAATIFHTTDENNVHDDIDTISEVFFILSRDGVLAAFGTDSNALLNSLTKRDANGQTTVNKIIDTINLNERTKPLITLIAKLSVTVMSQQAGISTEMIDTYDNIKTSINSNAMKIDKNEYESDTEYVEAVSDSLDQTLKENNIQLEKDIVDTMAQYIADNYSEKTEITDEEANDIILSYYDAYLDYIETGTIPEDIEGLIPD